MDGTIDLSFETFTGTKLPSAEGLGWVSTDLSGTDWTVRLTDTALSEVTQMIQQMRDKPLPRLLRNPTQFQIPHLRDAYKTAKNICDTGVGFAVIDRFPIEAFSIDEIVDVYWILGQLMGQNVAQKWNGTMIYDVTDKGKKFGYGVRASATNVELVFHTDNAFGINVPDYVGLLCKSPAKSGGLSRFCSLYTVHQRMEQEYPEELFRLYQPVHFDRQAEHAGNNAKTTFAPMFTWSDGKLRCRANSSLVRKGYDVAGLAMDSQLQRALKAIDEVTSSPDLWLEAPLSRGQVQYLNNHELGHYRSDFIDYDDEAKKRHLFRLWHRTEGGQTYDG
jgi:alpha-ketoglutarate-dependent taurine dioxygenase